ncbi:hypothetical protein TNCT_350721 [Trichonephila clavata]|uniref:Uncharacterized protein n=1 Tax=Trichonephila clavata TaxID=2740835 RepID=A0A8X6IMU7_TRICU|nr:hypothetical protein TNCT_350721 [Trichonephila clavata]
MKRLWKVVSCWQESRTFNAGAQGLINLAWQMKCAKSALARVTEIRSGRVINGRSSGSAPVQRKQPSKKRESLLYRERFLERGLGEDMRFCLPFTMNVRAVDLWRAWKAG